MLLEKERNLIVKYCRKLVTHGLTKGTGGNISVYNREQQLMAISPSGIEYDELIADDIVVLDLALNAVEGIRKPSSELEMHAIFYKKRDDVDAVVHTHSTYAKTLSVLRWPLPAVSYLVAFAGPNVRCAEYASFGTKQLAENAFAAMQDRYAVLLANHGLLAGGKNLSQAFNIAEQIEFCAEVYCRAEAIGQPVTLDDTEMERMRERFQSYGQQIDA